MSVKPIVQLGDPRLRLKGLPVDSFGKPLWELLDDLADTMRHAPGVGLAAPQLGEALRACVIEVEGQLHELVNPMIVRSSGDDRDLEGCLSIPGYVAYVTRREKVWVVAQNRVGKHIKVAGSGLLGRALQHELDHLDGKLYIDYLDSMDELIAVGQGGRMVALDLISGQRQWELNLAGISTPWVAGDWIFVVTDDAKLICVARQNGHIRWINQLPQFSKPKSKKGEIDYSGPVLAGGRLIVTGSNGVMINVDPTTGSFQSQSGIGAPISLSPVVANSTLYILDDRGRLTAFR